MAYSVNGVGAQVPSSATVSTLTNVGPYMTSTGSLNWARSEWNCTWSASHFNKIFSGRKSDDTGADTLPKYVDVTRFTLTYTCAAAYTPSAVASNATTLGSMELISLATTIAASVLA